MIFKKKKNEVQNELNAMFGYLVEEMENKLDVKASKNIKDYNYNIFCDTLKNSPKKDSCFYGLVLELLDSFNFKYLKKQGGTLA